MKYETHNFYCINCGKKAMDLPRKTCHKHKKLHRKKLYCPWCKQDINCIEISNEEEKIKFIEDFNKGLFKEEALESIKKSNGCDKYEYIHNL